MDFIHEIESAMGHEAEKIFLPMQLGDVYQTNADTLHVEKRKLAMNQWLHYTMGLQNSYNGISQRKSFKIIIVI